jgi:hypothetical protein
MGSVTVFNAIGDFMNDYVFGLFNVEGTNYINLAFLLLGFVGLFYWLNWQRKFNERAKNNPDQRK